VVLSRAGLGPERGPIGLDGQELGQIQGRSEGLTFDNGMTQVKALVVHHLVLTRVLNDKHVPGRGATLARRRRRRGPGL
jgi:hypothetical protein